MMNKKWCAAIVAAATLAGGMALAGSAYADEPEYSPESWSVAEALNTENKKLYLQAIHAAHEKAEETGKVQAIFYRNDHNIEIPKGHTVVHGDNNTGTFYIAPVNVVNNAWTVDEANPTETFALSDEFVKSLSSYPGDGDSGFAAIISGGTPRKSPLFVIPTKGDFCAGLTGTPYANCSTWRDGSAVDINEVSVSNIGKYSANVDVEYNVHPNSSVKDLKMFAYWYKNIEPTGFAVGVDWSFFPLNAEEKAYVTNIRMDEVPYEKGALKEYATSEQNAEEAAKEEATTEDAVERSPYFDGTAVKENLQANVGKNNTTVTFAELLPGAVYGNTTKQVLPFYAQFGPMSTVESPDGKVISDDISRTQTSVNNLLFNRVPEDSLMPQAGAKGFTVWVEWRDENGLLRHSREKLVPSFKTLPDGGHFYDNYPKGNPDEGVAAENDQESEVTPTGESDALPEGDNNDNVAGDDFGDFSDFGDFDDLGDLGDLGDFGDFGDLDDLGDLGDLGDLDDLGDFGDLGDVDTETTADAVSNAEPVADSAAEPAAM